MTAQVVMFAEAGEAASVDSPLVSAVIPCLNEEQTLAICIAKAQASFRAMGVTGEVVIADNGSEDRSIEIAAAMGARVVREERRGYGAALQRGIRESRGRIMILRDADDSYDWSAIEPFVRKVEEGYDLVMGNRFKGGIMPGAMPHLHRYVGNIAEELKIHSTFVETNCSWCTKDEITRERLNELKVSGLRGILISVNPFYAEFVPFERTERCIPISGDVFGRNVMIYQLEYYQLFRRLGIKKKISQEESLSIIQTEYHSAHVEFFMMGRAVNRLRDFHRAYRAEAFFRQPCRPEFLRSWHNHFDNYGNLLPGYCGGISLGNWLHLDSLMEELESISKSTRFSPSSSRRT